MLCDRPEQPIYSTGTYRSPRRCRKPTGISINLTPDCSAVYVDVFETSRCVAEIFEVNSNKKLSCRGEAARASCR